MKINIGVFFGGSSVEHEVSIISAVQAMMNMDEVKYHVIPLYFSKEGVLYTGDALRKIENYKNIDNMLKSCTPVVVARQSKDSVELLRAQPKKFSNNVIDKIDVAFPIVHGTNTEDGSYQGFFETLRIPYVGSDVLSSALGMDKVASKYVMRGAGLPVLDFVSFYAKDYQENPTSIITRIDVKFGFPVIVKPANLGSSIGIKLAKDVEELGEAISYASQFANRIIIERAITKLREINCAVIGDYERATASLCEEPMSKDEILSFSDKYLSDSEGAKGMSSAQRKLPAELSPELEEECKNLALQAFRTLGCSGIARIDLMIDTAEEKVYINELNTIPGSLAYYLFAAAGKNYFEIISELVVLAIKRHRERENLSFSFDTNILEVKGSIVSGVKK